MSEASSTNTGKRGWRQFSLRTLLVSVLVCAVGLLLWNIFVEPVRRQQRLLKQFAEMKGSFNGEAQDTWWSKLLFGEGYLLDIVTISLSGTSADDAWLLHLQDMPHLHTLILDRSSVGDAGLANLRYVSELEILIVGQTSITDAGLEHLQKLPRLKHLSLAGPSITDQGMASLALLSDLEVLDLKDTAVHDAGIAQLTGLMQLCRLRLDNTNVTESCIADLKKLPALKELSISGTAILPSELWFELPRLENQKITDALASPTAFEFVATPMEYLKDFHRIEIVLENPDFRYREDRLAESKIPTITATLRDRLDRALLKLLQPLGLKCVPLPGLLLITADKPGRPSFPRLRVDPLVPLSRKAAAALHKRIIIEFIETPFEDVCVYISGICGLKILLDEQGEVASQRLVTLNLRGLPTATVVEFLLNDFDLHGIVRDDTIHIYTGPLPPQPNETAD